MKKKCTRHDTSIIPILLMNYVPTYIRLDVCCKTYKVSVVLWLHCGGDLYIFYMCINISVKIWGFCGDRYQGYCFLILNFCRVLNVVHFLLGYWLASVWSTTCLWRWNRQIVPKRWHLNYRRRWITQKKAYNKVTVVLGCDTVMWQRGVNISLLWWRQPLPLK
jgi:hypothetical protein